jgi:integrase
MMTQATNDFLRGLQSTITKTGRDETRPFSATIGMDVEDNYPQGRRMWFRLHEKGGKYHAALAHHKAEEYVDAYLDAVGLADARKTPLFRTVSRDRRLTGQRMHRNDVLRMFKRRAREAGVPGHIGCHTFRATGIIAYRSNGGLLEHAMKITSQSSARTTKLYCTDDTVGLDEIERIAI